MRKLNTVFLSSLILCLALCLVAGCRGCRKYYWDYNCSWVCDEPQVELYEACGNGRMVIDDFEYNFCTAQANNATDITFYIEKDGQHKVLWEADTVLKDGKLYLTITQDNISNYQGKTIILLQKTD